MSFTSFTGLAVAGDCDPPVAVAGCCDSPAAETIFAPYYVKPTQEGIFRHYEAIAQSVEIPVIVYNVPSRTNSNITADTEARLAQIPNIGGVKEASGNIEQIREIIDRTPDDFAVISGDDAMTYDVMCSGGVGVFSVVSNCLPKEVSTMVDYLREGKKEQAKETLKHSERISVWKTINQFATSGTKSGKE